MAQSFATLDDIYTMFTPSDLIGTYIPCLGQASQAATNPTLASFLGVISNTGRGVYTIADLIAKLQSLSAGSSPAAGNPDLSQVLTIYTNSSVPTLGPSTPAAQMAVGPDGSTQTVTSLAQIIGPDFVVPNGAPAASMPLALILSKSPYFSPQARNTHRAEIFLNSMPSVVLSQLVPFLQVEFQSARPGQVGQVALEEMGLLKFLEGAVKKSSLGAADNAMFEAHQVAGNPAKVVSPATVGQTLDYAGMEMFTAPQTLVNPQPNKNVSTNGTRYADVLDPFRPFATLEHVTLSIKPAGHGFYTFKTGNMSIKLHDRSRLSEIADLIRVNIYSGITIWMTYGWRAPVRPGQNSYFDYVNDNLLVREAFGVQNTSFAFDDHGQVIINLQLYTKAVAELRDIKITDQFGDAQFDNRQIKDLVGKINEYSQKLNQTPAAGINKEIRVSQILQAAETGQFPDTTPAQVQTQIAALRAGLAGQGSLNQADLTGLITALQTLYKPAQGDKAKFDYKQRYEAQQTKTIAAMFNEARTGLDPFLPRSIKNAGANPVVGASIAAICDQLNAVPANKAATAQANVVSFGKLFSVFAMRGIVSLPPGTVDEAQVFFYNLNTQCGPIGSHSIAEFPIAMNDFMSQFEDMRKSKGGENIQLEDFLELCINAQFNDVRAIGYGLHDLYTPWKSEQEPTYKNGPNIEGQVESRRADQQKANGPFKWPQIEMAIEVSHQRVAEAGQNDVLIALAYQSTTATSITPSIAQALAAKKILRIHVYDKAMTPNQTAARLLRGETNDNFIQIPPSLEPFASGLTPSTQGDLNNIQSALKSSIAGQNVPSPPPAGSFMVDGRTGVVTIPQFGSNQQIKDVVSKFIPTIKFGVNGTTITKASLTSKADPKVAANNLINSQAARNTAHPNGSGDLGIPLRVIPAQLTMTSLGNPLASAAQQYFIDFNTGCTLDNIYILTHLTHNFSPGKFETQWTFGYWDAYGTYEGAPNIVDALALTKASLGAVGS
jgi:hypothetical protein